jgi:hypothetical protein
MICGIWSIGRSLSIAACPFSDYFWRVMRLMLPCSFTDDFFLNIFFTLLVDDLRPVLR